MRIVVVLLASLVVVLGACTFTAATPAPTSRPASIAPATPAASTVQPTSPTQTAAPTPRVSPAPSAVVLPTTSEPSTAPTAGPGEAPSTATWTKLRPAVGPSPREDHTWTIDTEGQMAYLFGGRAGGTLHGDLWVYDLAADTWTELRGSAGPAARFGHEAVWLPGQGLLIFAGQAGPTFFNDLWLYDPAVGWSELPAGGEVPVPRYGTCAALAPDGRLWISHGFTEDGTRFADTRVYDFASGVWADETPTNGQLPVERCLHGCWFDVQGAFVLYAGQTTGVTALGDLWSLARPGDAESTWRRVEVDLPPTRNLYAQAWWNTDRLVFGGKSQDGTFLNDLWAFDLVTLEPRPIQVSGEPPSGRAGATLIEDPIGGRLLLFGGKRYDGTFEDLWQLTLA